jgi:hypothetical protein
VSCKLGEVPSEMDCMKPRTAEITADWCFALSSEDWSLVSVAKSKPLPVVGVS